MLLSNMFSIIALLGAATCLSISASGLFNGPYCLYHVGTMDVVNGKWGYPFKSEEPCVFSNSTNVYLFDIPVWSSVCIEPPHIVPWNSGLFSSLCLISILEIILSLFQFINAFLGMIGGHCDGRK
ncbi:hypothetical protein GDO86_010328, partial [Hymenochirus boettgeri]